MKSSREPINEEQDSSLDIASGRDIEKYTGRIFESDYLKIEILKSLWAIKYPPRTGSILPFDYEKALQECITELNHAKYRKSIN